MTTALPNRPSRPRPDRGRAWVCVLVNQLAFPGLGTVWAGQRGGYAQAALMLAGFFLVVGFVFWFLLASFQRLLSGNPDSADLWALLRAHAWIGLAGLALSALAWCWALFSSLAILRQAQAPSEPNGEAGRVPPSPPPLSRQNSNHNQHTSPPHRS